MHLRTFHKLMLPLCALVVMIITTGPGFAQRPLVVEIVTATSAMIERRVSLTGEIVARDSLTVSFPNGGRIDSVDVQEGDTVAAGTVLARITNTQQEQALRGAKAAVLTAKADRDQALEDLRRQEALLNRGATTRVARDSASDQAQVKEGVLAQANADLDLAMRAFEDTVVTAPQAATVTARYVEPGQVVGNVQPVVELALGSTVDALFDVPESLLTNSIEPTAVQLAPLGRPDQVFTGRVREVSPIVDSATGTIAIRISVSEKPAYIQFGDAIRGTTNAIAGAGIILPYRAMSATADGPSVWIVDPASMTVSMQQITIDRFETDSIIVKDGIPEGTLVVTAGAQLLFPGRLVQSAGDVAK